MNEHRIVQRWNGGRASYRPAGEPINTSVYSVELIDDDTTAKEFVLEHHYSGSFPSARVLVGLYWGRWLVGLAVFSTPQNPRTLDVLPGGRESGIELGRFILLDCVPANGETWFLARCFELLRQLGFTGVVSFSDPVARRCSDGTVVFPGHIGTVAGCGFNHPPDGLRCTGDEACRAACGKLCVHAEMMALRDAGATAGPLELVHVKVVDGKFVPGGGPSCSPCARDLLDDGRVVAVWLFHVDGWRRYELADFYALTIRECGLPILRRGTDHG